MIKIKMDLNTNLHIINRIFNIHSKEWPKVLSTFAIRFFFKASFVIAWTLIVTLFIELFGIRNLPFLFIINAFFTIIASLIYSTFLFRFSHVLLITIFLFCSGILIFLASLVYGLDKHLFLFFLIVIESIFLIQSKILLSAHIETRFSLLESERVFPLTEAFETFGAIFAGVILFSFSYVFSIQSFLYIWIIFLFSAIPFLLYSIGNSSESVPLQNNRTNFRTFLKRDLFDVSKGNFLKGLVVIIFLQWVIYNLVEFQYVSALYYNVGSVVLEGGSGFEHAFIHDLGGLFVLFNASALVCQLILASRLLNNLGIIGSMLLHPIITFFSFIIFLFNNGFYTILFAKNNFVISSVVFSNAYHCSFYAVKEDIREFFRQFLEGIIRPIGAIIGTLLLFLFQFIFPNNNILFINLAIIFIALFYFFLIKSQKDNYYKNAFWDFTFSNEISKRINAIEILSQKTGKNGFSMLIHSLNDINEFLSIKIKIIEVLGRSEKLFVLKYLINGLDNRSELIQLSSLDALTDFFNTFKFRTKKHLFIRVEIMQKLKDLFKKEKNDQLRGKIINLIGKINDFSALEFLLSLLKCSDDFLVNESIKSLGTFKILQLENVLLEFSKSSSLEKQIYSAIALYKIKKKEKSVIRKINKFLDSEDKHKILLSIYSIGELKLKDKKKELFSMLYSNDLEIKKESAIALSKMGFYESVPVLLEFVFHENLDFVKAIKSSLKFVDRKISFQFKRLYSLIFDDKIKELKEKIDFIDYNSLDDNMKTRLSLLYAVADDFEEVEKIINS